MLRRTAIGLLLALLVALPVGAQEGLLGTKSIEFNRLSTQGRIFGCSLVYKALIRDHVYKQGGLVLVHGNISLTGGKGNIIVSLKVILNDMKVSSSGISDTPSKPHFAYLQSGDGRNNVSSFIRKFGLDTPGALVLVYKFDDAFTRMMMNMAVTDAITIVYSMNKGGLDVPVELDLAVRQIHPGGNVERSKTMVMDWLKCFQELGRSVLKEKK